MLHCATSAHRVRRLAMRADALGHSGVTQSLAVVSGQLTISRRLISNVFWYGRNRRELNVLSVPIRRSQSIRYFASLKLFLMLFHAAAPAEALQRLRLKSCRPRPTHKPLGRHCNCQAPKPRPKQLIQLWRAPRKVNELGPERY